MCGGIIANKRGLSHKISVFPYQNHFTNVSYTYIHLSPMKYEHGN